MYCIFEDTFEKLKKTVPTEILPRMIEEHSVQLLPYCAACLECKDMDYKEILDSEKIPLMIRYLFVMAKGMQSVIANELSGRHMLILMSKEGKSEKEIMDAVHTVVDNSFKEFHAFFDLLVDHYKDDFKESIDISTLFEEISGDGLRKLLVTKRLKLKHIICQIHQIMMHNDYQKSIGFLASTYLRNTSYDRKSCFKCAYKMFNEPIGVWGSNLHEGEADYWAFIDTNRFLESLKIDIKRNMDDTEHYVIEKKMYKMLLDTIVRDGEMVKNLFEMNPAFLKNHCLFAEIIKSSDEFDIRTYKKALTQIKDNN